jgi:acyl-CoA thioesterase-1
VRPRWLVAPILTALLAISLASGCGTSVGPSRFTQGIVAFGDSLVVGFGAGSGNDFVSLLESRLSVNIVNAGRLGDTTASGLARLDEDVLNREREIVIVLLGGNDLLQGVPVQQRISNITSIVQRIRGTGADVILVGLGDGPLDAFAGALVGLASQTSSTLVPGILEGIFGQPALMFDAIHPNSAGHKIMADRLEPALRALVNQSQTVVKQ